MIEIRLARICDSEVLTDLAVRSEAYWGYDPEFMESFRTMYGITEEFIGSNPTYAAYDDGMLVGFYALLLGDKADSLEYLFIEPRCIGKGYGKLLWNHMTEQCGKLGVEELEIVTSPQAEEFYTKLGAVPVGEVESLVRKGRKVPRLIYKVEEQGRMNI